MKRLVFTILASLIFTLSAFASPAAATSAPHQAHLMRVARHHHRRYHRHARNHQHHPRQHHA